MSNEDDLPKYDTAYWSDEIEAWEKRSRQWHKQGRQSLKRFLDSEDKAKTNSEFRLNLFHNHINTLLSMLYGSMPKVDVSRRYNDPDDDVARVAGLILNRILNTDIEAAGEDFASMLRGSLQDRLIPGLGIARVRYEVEKEEFTVPATFTPEGITQTDERQDTRIISESVPMDYIHWEDFAWSFARNWGEVTWVGFKTRISKQSAIERFGAAKAKKLEYKQHKIKEDALDSNRDMEDKRDTAEVWEFWCSDTMKVHWVQKDCDQMLDEKDDPLQLSNFWPCPPPMMANQTTTLLMPVPDFKLSQDLYNEVDKLQTRISMITKAMKVVGVYDKSADGVTRMLSEGYENDLIPVDNWAMFAEKGGLAGTIDWMPIKDIADALDRLRGVRNETIQLLYQVTGLQDMMQGSLGGGQPTSATEQALRARFASVRVQYLQDDFARFASNLQALKGEIISKHFSPETIVKQSNIMTSSNREYAEPAVGLIKDLEKAQWSIKIRTESIAMIDYAQLKAERTEYLTALSTFLQSAQAAGKASPGIVPMLLELLKWGLAGFKGSAEIEGVVDKAMDTVKKELEMKAKQPPKPDPKMLAIQAKAKADQQKHQQDMQKEQVKAVNEMKKLNADLQKALKEIKAKTQGKMIEEAVQAHFAILEQKAKGGRGEESG